MLLNKTVTRLSLLLLSLVLSISTNFAQKSEYSNSSILQSLKKLNVLGSVLYVAAHPDDENTAVLTYMSKGKLVRTAYLSLTRGDGGQNLLGNEKGDLLGVIRTQELLSARKIDGAKQFFTRAIDFGYSKSADETLKNWNRKILLGDVVKVIREFKPDVIVTRFSKTQGGHGQHLASAILAEEAFYAAADPTQYPEQLISLSPWQAKRLYWNTWSPNETAVSIDIGEYNNVIGKSYNEIAATARSMHKTQGFGVSPNRGSQLNQFNFFAGDSAKEDLFDNIDISWRRLENGENYEKKINKIIDNYNDNHPDLIVKELVELYVDLESLSDEYWKNVKQNEVKELIKQCSGLWMESIMWEAELTKGENYDVRNTIVNRSNLPIKLILVKTKFGDSPNNVNKLLSYNEPLNIKNSISIPIDHNYSQPYWLKEEHDGKFFKIVNESDIGKAENEPEIKTEFRIEINGVELAYVIPTIHKWNDAIKGEQFRPIVIRPELSIKVDQSLFVFANGNSHEVNVKITSKIDSADGEIYATLPAGWNTDKKSQKFKLIGKGDNKTFSFVISPNKGAKSGNIQFYAMSNGKKYNKEIVQIDYPHIEHQTVLQETKVELVNLDIEIVSKKIGYIMGSGDEIPNNLRQVGYMVDELTDEDINSKDLSEYDVIICGVRAFNTREKLELQQKRLNEFVKNGGTWIVQHNTRFGFQVNQIGPYPFSTTGRDRIAEEDAKLEILVPGHQIFNYPNKISDKDFNNWVQERGLYFADSWEGKLYPLLSGSDSGEPAKLGGLLYANYGKGVFIFTALSWFRQLPAGVPGAYRIFANMISAEGKK